MKKRRYRIIGILAIVLIVLWAISGHIHLQFWNGTQSTTNFQPSTFNLQQIQNITGKLLIFPWAFDQFFTMIGHTQTWLQIQTYEFTEKKIKDLFKNLLDKGVSIQLILENHPYEAYVDEFTPIKNAFSGYADFAIKSDQQMKTEYVHSKIDLMDQSFLIKTANLTHSSLFSNREYMFYSTDSWVLQSLKTIFAKDRAGEPIKPSDIHPNLVICNINCRTVIESILQQAKSSIIIQTQYINDPAILDILSSQQKKLSEMKLLVADVTTNDMLKSYLPAVTKKLSKPYLHAKMILIDHKILLLWSMNLSANSLDKNREIWILLLDPTLISQFSAQFTKDWGSGR